MEKPIKEMAMVFNGVGLAIFWLGPNGSSEGAIADSNVLWHRIWTARDELGGIAHSHPWNGPANASHTDVTTFAAIERGLGKRLIWPIVTMTHVNFFAWDEKEKQYLDVMQVDFRDTEQWHNAVKTLRQLSTGG